MKDYTPVWGAALPTEEWLVWVGWVGQWGQTPELLTSPQLESLGGLQRLVQKCKASVAQKKTPYTSKEESGLLEVSKENGVDQIQITLWNL